MKNNKKISLSIVLASLITVSLVSCGSSSVKEDSTASKTKVEEKADGKVQYGLEELNWDPDNYKALVNVIRNMERIVKIMMKIKSLMLFLIGIIQQ
ncbi:hypothetical protein PL326_01610 [Clostridium perfringens D]|nr:hypothetical protein [Clostridium perfringens]WEV13415.1 hypothetical protein PL326_01610 [Clostridium perfringens D]